VASGSERAGAAAANHHAKANRATFYLCFKGSEDRLRLAFGQQQRKDANALAAGIGVS
jgi:hypothetical protein